MQIIARSVMADELNLARVKPEESRLFQPFFSSSSTKHKSKSKSKAKNKNRNRNKNKNGTEKSDYRCAAIFDKARLDLIVRQVEPKNTLPGSLTCPASQFFFYDQHCRSRPTRLLQAFAHFSNEKKKGRILRCLEIATRFQQKFHLKNFFNALDDNKEEYFPSTLIDSRWRSCWSDQQTALNQQNSTIFKSVYSGEPIQTTKTRPES